MAERTCRLVTLGCKVNQYETQLLKETLLRNGFREASADESADLCVVNTCTVTATGDSKGRQLIRRLARDNPQTRTLVMGCYATRDPETVSQLPGVFEVIRDKRELPDVLQRMGVSDLPSGISEFSGRQRAFVKVQDGCILRCSYCIIPKVRPGLQSRTPQSIEEEVRRLVDNGYQEIVLTGIHVGHFGVDTTRGRSGKRPFRLWHLIRQLDRIPGDWRMRLSSMEAVEINDDFLAAVRDCEHLCPHFHPALQSGSNTVLHRMRRRYTADRFLETVEQIRAAIPDAALTTDVIVGFPGESEAEFEETLDVCRRSDFMKIHVFPFSAREGTPAAEMTDQVPQPTIRRRCQDLSELGDELASKFYNRCIGRIVEVLVEQPAKQAGWMKGTDRRYVPVRLRATSRDAGRLVRGVCIDSVEGGVLVEREGSNCAVG